VSGGVDRPGTMPRFHLMAVATDITGSVQSTRKLTSARDLKSYRRSVEYPPHRFERATDERLSWCRNLAAGMGRRICFDSHQLEVGACASAAPINKDHAPLCWIEIPPTQPSTFIARAGRRLSWRDTIIPHHLSRPLKLGYISPRSAEPFLVTVTNIPSCFIV
jgi:hypothetical protein